MLDSSQPGELARSIRPTALVVCTVTIGLALLAACGSGRSPVNASGDGAVRDLGVDTEPTSLDLAIGDAGRCPPAWFGPNHGHELEIPRAHLRAARARTYSIRGTSMHSHAVWLDLAQLSRLAGGVPVVTRSTIGAAHTHEVRISCP